MFKITGKKGFQITFENGWTVSVQFGPSSCCANCDMDLDQAEKAGMAGSPDAECAVIAPYGDGLCAHPMFDGGTVGRNMSPAQVLELMNWAAGQSAK